MAGRHSFGCRNAPYGWHHIFKKFMSERPTAFVMCAGMETAESAMGMKARNLGAIDIVSKPLQH